MESGRAPLEKAEMRLCNDAREFYMDRKTRTTTSHAIRMGEAYMSRSPESRGDQLEANRKIATLNTDRANIVSEARKQELARAEAATATAQAATANAQAATATALGQLQPAHEVRARPVRNPSQRRQSPTTAAARADQAAAEARTAALRAELAGYEQEKTALGVMLILRDLQFSSGSAVLGAGAQGTVGPACRLSSPSSRTRKIQIAGHTDSQGSACFQHGSVGAPGAVSRRLSQHDGCQPQRGSTRCGNGRDRPRPPRTTPLPGARSIAGSK